MIEINLLPDNLKIQAKKIDFKAKRFLSLLPWVVAVLVVLHIYLFTATFIQGYQLGALNKKWRVLEPKRNLLAGFKEEYDTLSSDSATIKQLMSQRISWAEKLNKLSLSLPSGVWLNTISFSRKEFTLKGSVISLQKEEMGLINKFLDTLKNDAGFFKDFTKLEVSSIERKTIGSYDIIDFILLGTLR